MKIGAHVSITGGIWKAPWRATTLGCETMQIFTRSPQGGSAATITPAVTKKFQQNLQACQINPVYVHAPYYINLASVNNRIRYGSANAIREELARANALGVKYVMTHLGTAKDLGAIKARQKVIQMLKQALAGYRGKTKLLLENSTGGEVIGSHLDELSAIMKAVDSLALAGICLDTQHGYASGYDWKNFYKTLEQIDQELGLDKIKLIHANDSQSILGSNIDRHEHIGKGKIGKKSFKKITAFATEKNIDMILETKHDAVTEDIILLKNFRQNETKRT